MAIAELDQPARQALARLLETPKLEVLPLRSTLDRIDALTPGRTVAISASPSLGMEATIHLAEQLEARGMRAVPHLSARMIRDRGHLGELLERLAAAGIDRAFVVGGDAANPGAFRDSLALLREMAELGSHITEIGIAGYPQGHPRIPDQRLRAALATKAPFAAYVTTQLCFDARAISAWVAELRSEGVKLPVHVGIAGAVQAHRLLEISLRIGVVDAGRYLLRHGQVAGRLLRPGGYQPDGVLEGLAPTLPLTDTDVRQLHVYTFNQIQATEKWREAYLASLVERAG
jgi:methylenetetrahydrofolate reductase (NADPH)